MGKLYYIEKRKVWTLTLFKKLLIGNKTRMANVNNIKRFGNEHISDIGLKMKTHPMSNFDIIFKYLIFSPKLLQEKDAKKKEYLKLIQFEFFTQDL